MPIVGPFDNTAPYHTWPEAERVRYIRHLVERIPGAIAVTPLRLLLDELEQLLARIRTLEQAPNRPACSPVRPPFSHVQLRETWFCSRCGSEHAIEHDHIYEGVPIEQKGPPDGWTLLPDLSPKRIFCPVCSPDILREMSRESPSDR